MNHFIYKTTNLINNKIYVGVHSSKTLTDSYLGSGKILNKAIKKYGKENFKREILFVCDTKEEAYDIEEIMVCENFIKRFDVYNSKVGGKGAALGWLSVKDSSGKILYISKKEYDTREDLETLKHSTKTKEKMSQKKYDYYSSMTVEERKTGIPLSEEHKNKISEAQKGIPRIPLSEELKDKNRNAMNEYYASMTPEERKIKYGREKTAEEIQKIKYHAQNQSEDTKKKRSDSLIEYYSSLSEEERKLKYGREKSEEEKIQIGLSLKGKKRSCHTEESKNRMSESAKINRHKLSAEERKLKYAKPYGEPCPYCGIETSVSLMKRYHLDNCKHKK